jgi:hypothetical protein
MEFEVARDEIEQQERSRIGPFPRRSTSAWLPPSSSGGPRLFFKRDYSKSLSPLVNCWAPKTVVHFRKSSPSTSIRLTCEGLAEGGVKTVPLPARSPNLNAFAERWVPSVNRECQRVVR